MKETIGVACIHFIAEFCGNQKIKLRLPICSVSMYKKAKNLKSVNRRQLVCFGIMMVVSYTFVRSIQYTGHLSISIKYNFVKNSSWPFVLLDYEEMNEEKVFLKIYYILAETNLYVSLLLYLKRNSCQADEFSRLPHAFCSQSQFQLNN